MAFHRGPYIVKDGLVLSLDAANVKSYVSGSTTWQDLSKNNYSGSLINGPIYSSDRGGSIVLDGTNDYIRLNTNPLYALYNSNLANQKWTIEVWHNMSKKGNSQFIIGPYGGSISFGIFLEFGSSTKGLMWTDGGKYLYSNSSLVGKGPTHVCFIFSGSSSQRSQYIYLDGKLDATRTDVVVDTYPSLASNMYIGGDGSSGGSVGNLYAYKIYNKALSASEVQQNYNALKGRYGI
jgi:hypothetical protein